MKLEDYMTRLEKLSASSQSIQYNSDYYARNEDVVPFHARGLTLLGDIFGINHAYYQAFDKATKIDSYPVRSDVSSAVKVLELAIQDLRDGYFTTIKNLVAAEFFSDFMEMADYFLSEGYKDAAAVMIGGVLEEHLRQLCRSHGVDLEVVKPNGDAVAKKADVMNSDLVKAGVYTVTDQKQVTAWLDLRNLAAHSKYTEYTEDQIKLMYQGVLNFLTRVSA